MEASGHPLKERLHISKKAHLILPTHRILDAAYEAAKGCLLYTSFFLRFSLAGMNSSRLMTTSMAGSLPNNTFCPLSVILR